jgi:predicted Zn-dependent protease
MCFSHGARMAFERVTRMASIPALFLAAVLCFLSALPAAAITLLRDPDIEHGLSRISAPILRAAGLSATNTRIYLVNDSKFNAFVIDNKSIFLNYGLISKIDDVTLLQAVIAHEAAHISNGHITQRLGNLQSARTAAGLGLALALIAAAASGSPDAGFGIAAGTSSSAFRSFLSHTRAEESSADRSAAAYLTAAGVSPRALVNLHGLFAGQELLSPGRQDPYARSHPLSRDRMRAAQAYVAAHGDKGKDNPDADYWFARIKGKITAFKRAPKWTLRRVREEKYKDVRLMREAVAYHRQNDLSKALRSINQALSLRPGDPYYQELKGQILMENRRWNDALAAYKRASGGDSRNALILGGYGRALLAAGQPKSAIPVMEKARARDFRDPRLLRDMSLAYARTGQNGMAAVVTAERYALQGRLEDAGLHAKRAVALLPRGSAAWRRAQDVLLASERFAKGKKKR